VSAALVTTAHVTAAGENGGISPGATVIVSRDRVPLKVGRAVVADLRQGMKIHVSKVKGAWVGGHVVLQGQKRSGWVMRNAVEAADDVAARRIEKLSRYRLQAERQVHALIGERLAGVGWSSDGFTIEPDARSRFFVADPADRPPMPPDDAASHRLVRRVDGERGWPYEKHYGYSDHAENPDWMKHLPCDEEGQLVLDGREAVRLAILNSPAYQRELEDVYLSALEVMQNRTRPGGGPGELIDAERVLLANMRQLDRFRRGFHLWIITGRHPGPGPEPAGLAMNELCPNSPARIGGFIGLLQTLQEIHNQRGALVASRLNYRRQMRAIEEAMLSRHVDIDTVVGQRLQVAQARQAVLRAETQLEVAEARYESQLDRFKITLGLPPDICVQIKEPMLDRLNLIDRDVLDLQEEISELQQAVGDGIEMALDVLLKADETNRAWRDTLTRKLDQLRAQFGEVEEIRGRLTVGDDSQIRRFHADGARLLDILEQTIEQHMAGYEDGVQPQDLRSDIALLARIRNEIDSDGWWQKIPGFSRFNLLRDQIHDIDSFRLLLHSGGRVNIEWMRSDTNPSTRAMYEKYRYVVQALEDMSDAEAKTTHDEIVGWLDRDIEPLNDQYKQMMQDYVWLEQLDRWRAIPYEVEGGDEAGTVNRIRLLQRLFAQLVDILLDTSAKLDTSGSFDSLAGNVRVLQQEIDELIANVPNQTPAELTVRFRGEISRRFLQELWDLAANMRDLSLVQARTRAETVSLVHIDLHPVAALDLARVNRRDWMNARAILVDQWRQIASGDRLSDPYQYRRKLLTYQRARREYYAFEDRVNQALRETLRSMRSCRNEFELRRGAISAAIDRVEHEEDIRLVSEIRSQTARGTAGTVDALHSLLEQQDAFLRTWVRYESLRRSLDFDLGTMQLDDQGMWIDPGPIVGQTRGCPDRLEESPAGPEVPGPEVPPLLPELPRPASESLPRPGETDG